MCGALLLTIGGFHTGYALCKYLTLKRYFFYRNHNTPIFDGTRKVFRAMPKHNRRGAPDVIVGKDGKYFGIEVKTAKRKLSEHQLQFGRDLILAGGMYVIARTVDDLIAAGM